MESFLYTAEQYDGTRLSGSLDAADSGSAERQLQALGLRVLEMAPAALRARPLRLGVADLQTFNEFLLQISQAGVPVEQGLRALSSEMRSSRLKASIDALVSDLEAGRPIERAIADRRGSFPPLYGKLLDAGIQSGDLPAVLQQFGRHMDDMAALRESLWRAIAYPTVVLIALLLLLTFLSYWLLPMYFDALQKLSYRMFDYRTGSSIRWTMTVPPIALAVYWLGKIAPLLLAVAAALVAVALVALGRARAGRGERRWIDRLVLPLPVVGRAVRDSFVASWLDVLGIGVGAGLDLPRALRLAGSAVGLPSLAEDSEALSRQVEGGQPAGAASLHVVPATVPLALDVAGANLRTSIAALAAQYRAHAERQMRLIPGRVMPALLILIAAVAGLVMYSLWIPIAQLLRHLMG